MIAMSPLARARAALFHSVSARTAGFNTCALDENAISPAGHFVLTLLMFIGGFPPSPPIDDRVLRGVSDAACRGARAKAEVAERRRPLVAQLLAQEPVDGEVKPRRAGAEQGRGVGGNAKKIKAFAGQLGQLAGRHLARIVGVGIKKSGGGQHFVQRQPVEPDFGVHAALQGLSLIHLSEPTRPY